METNCPHPVITCDWFSFSIRSYYKPAALPPQFEEEVQSGTNVFKRRAIYTYRGAKVLTALSLPKSKILPQDMILIEVANRWLYDYCELENILTTMWPSYRFSNMSRIDLAADFEVNESTMDLINKLSTGEYYVNGKKLGSMFFEDGKKRQVFDMNFGSVRSDVKWKVYNKTKEIGATTCHCTKPWITAWWKKNGLPVDNIWRLEVSYHGEKFQDIERRRVGLQDLYNTTVLRLVFAEFYKYRFVVKKRGHTRRVNDKVVPFLDIWECQEDYIERQRARIGGRYDDSDEARLLLNRLVQSYINSVTLSHAVKLDAVLLIKRLCSEYGYFQYVRERWEWDFECQNPRKVLRG